MYIPKLLSQFNLTINGVIQIGAHYGQEYFHLKKHGINNFVMIEPVPRHFQKMKEKITDENVLMFKIALGAEEREIEMFLSDFEGEKRDLQMGMSSSILKPKKHLNQYPHIQFREKIKVNMTKLDNLIKDENIDINKYNMMIIDVQGYELEVLKGAEETLNNIDCIYTEVNREELYENCSMINDIDHFLFNYGFNRKHIDWTGGTWGDAFYISTSLSRLG